MIFETRRSRAAFHGRLVDELTRRTVPFRQFEAALREPPRQPFYKEDGSFVFTDLEPSSTPYEILLSAAGYRSRRLQATLPGAAAVPLSFPGEDELYVVVTALTADGVSFAAIPFLRAVPAGSPVLGPGAFATALAQTLEGENVDFADLADTAGLAVGDVLRILRSSRLLMRPGPAYDFPAGSTVVALRVDDAAAQTPLEGARLEIDQLDGAAVAAVSIGGLDLHRATVGAATLVLGPDDAVTTFTDGRGEAVFHFPAATAVTGLRVQVTSHGYLPATQLVAVTAGARVRATVTLMPA